MIGGITGFICWFSRFPEASKICRMSKTTVSGCPTVLTSGTGSLQSALYSRPASVYWTALLSLHTACLECHQYNSCMMAVLHTLLPPTWKSPPCYFQGVTERSASHGRDKLSLSSPVWFPPADDYGNWSFLKKPATTSSKDSQASGMSQMPLLILPLPPAEPWEEGGSPLLE